MIKSMTAFASEEISRNGITVLIEIRCYNSRHLDPAIRLPSAHANMEEQIRQMISSRIQRGRVEIKIGIDGKDAESRTFRIDEQMADAYYHALNNLRNRYAIDDPISLDDMMQMRGIIEPVEADTDTSAVSGILEEALIQALDNVDKMRQAEGNAIAADLAERTNRIESHVDRIQKQTDGLLESYRARLMDRINALTQGMVEIDPGRIAQEAAFIADKSDISEEITRAKSHLSQFRSLMDGKEPAGKPLNFLLQEFSREFNTMGSKAGNADISHIIVSAKTEIEKIREQVQNVE